MSVKKAIFLLFIIICSACRKPFQPSVVSADHNYLVVEGVVNSGSDSTFIKLSRTTLLNSTQVKPESGATVIVESDKNDTYNLTEVLPGTYSTVNLNLPVDRKYRLHIMTTKNKEYASEYVENKITPEVDSISFKELAHGVQFYVNTHDNTNKTRYYRWNYDETWTYFSLIYSNLLYRNEQVDYRTSDELVYFCYRHAVPSNALYVATSNKLAHDVILQSPLGYIDASSQKLVHIYSMHVNQYALTPEAYNFWQLLKKNTEQLGSIFDPAPSSSIGNIHSLADPSDIVIGFMSVSTITSKRVFISGRDLPFALPAPPIDTSECNTSFIPLEPLSSLDDRLRKAFYTGDNLPFTVHEANHKIDGYLYAKKECVDCRVAGGTTIKPPYWP
jgi:hypothetical protein